MPLHTLDLPDYHEQAPEVAARFARIRERPVVLSVKNLRKDFGTNGSKHTVFDGVSLDIRRREFVTIIGPSGCGKSTFIRIAAGLDEATSGEMLLDGQPITGPSPDRGMVFQGYTLFPWRTVKENVMFGLEMRGKDSGTADAEARQWLEMVGLARVENSYPHELSGGMKQRVAIARALANEPGVLLYDEPLAHLDPSRRGEIRGLVRRVAATRTTTVVYVTHDPAEALEVGDALAVLAGGRVVDAGAPADVYARPRSLASARALGAVSSVAARRRDDDAVECTLGTVAAHGRPGLASGWLLLRPEQVGARTGGDAVVTESFAVPGAHAFRARLRDGATVEGRAAGPLPPGTAVTLSVTGTGVLVPAEEVA